MSGRVGILGGMFDPIHRGHIDVAVAAQSALGLAEMLVVPARIPPHRPQPFASSFHRFAMVALTVNGRPGWRASDMELLRDEPSFTSATLTALHGQGHTASNLFFVTGADAFVEIETWRDYPGLLDLAHFVVVSRPGLPVEDLTARLPALASRMTRLPLAAGPLTRPSIVLIDAATANVSSTSVRDRLAGAQSIAGMVDPGVEQHIERHGLYRSPAGRPPRADGPRHGAAGRLHG